MKRMGYPFSACARAEVVLCGKIPGLLPLLIPGGPALKRELVPQHCSGSNLATLCLTEGGADSDVRSTRTKACRVGHQYLVDRDKRFVTNGGKPPSMRSLPTSSQNWVQGNIRLHCPPRCTRLLAWQERGQDGPALMRRTGGYLRGGSYPGPLSRG